MGHAALTIDPEGSVRLKVTGALIMVATSRIQFPDDMAQVLHTPDASTLEALAVNGLERVKDYARDEPVKFALWAFGIGFVLGWKLKPW
jgi:hypothetical protein